MSRVTDRLIQQALHQVLSPLFEPTFSDSSYGFRPGKIAHQAVKAAKRYITEWRRIVVDLDLSKFFDRVNHDILYARQPERDNSLIRHSDRGSHYISIRYTARLAWAGIEPSVGSKGDSYDNALAETINGVVKG